MLAGRDIIYNMILRLFAAGRMGGEGTEDDGDSDGDRDINLSDFEVDLSESGR